MRSIRRRLMLGTALGTLFVVAAAGVIMDRGLRGTLSRELDRSMEDKARLLASTLALTDKGLEIDFHDYDMREFEREREPSFLKLWLAEDSLLYESPSLRGIHLPPLGEVGVEPSFRRLSLDGGRKLRALTMQFSPRLDVEEDEEPVPDEGEAEEASEAGEETEAAVEPELPRITLLLAQDTAAVDALLARLRALLAVIGLAAGFLLVAVQRVLVQRAMTPLDHLARQIDQLDETKLSARVELPDAPLEIAPVAARLNDLMDRLDEAFQRERSFSADIAHELRTPLAGLRTSIEVELSRPRQAGEYRQALADSLAIVQQMQDMTQTLLFLSRLESGQVEVERKVLDLAALVRETCDSTAPLAEQRGLSFERGIPATARVVGDPSLLATAIRNIVENAVAHADPNGVVRVMVEGEGAAASLKVINSGSLVSQAEVPTLFDRFTRGDRAREGTSSHFGLGLALVKRAASRLGLSVAVTSSAGGDFVLTLSGFERPEESK